MRLTPEKLDTFLDQATALLGEAWVKAGGTPLDSDEFADLEEHLAFFFESHEAD